MKLEFLKYFSKPFHTLQEIIRYKNFNPLIDKPKVIYIELTGHCNLRCPHCPRTYSNKRRGHINDSLYYDIIDNIKIEYPNLPEIGFHVFGEILMKKNFGKLIKYANKNLQDTKLSISTNLNTTNDDLVLNLINCGINSIGIWPDAFSEEGYQAFRKGGSLELVKKNIIKLLNEREKSNSKYIDIHIGTVQYKSDYSKVHNFIKEFEFIKNYPNTRMLKILSHDWAGQVPVNNVYLSIKNKKIKIPKICFFPFTMLVFASDGSMSLCCVDMNLQLKLGKFDKNLGIDKIWTSEQAKNLRKMISGLSPPKLCKNCHHKYFSWYSTSVDQL